MYQIEIPEFGGPEVLTLREVPDVQPGPGEVRIHVAAAGVNFADVMARMGLYDSCPPLPAVMGWEIAGQIDAVGEGVDPARIGQRVLAICDLGGYATHRVVGEDQALPFPDDLSYAEAAAIPVHGLSCWMMAVEMGRVREGDRVLLHGAGGGLGLMLVQLLKTRGCTVVGTASPRKFEALEARGIDQLIDYRTRDFREELDGEERFDLALDPVGGESWRKSFELLRAGGKLICFGFSTAITSKQRNWLSLIGGLRKVPWLMFQPLRLRHENKGVFGMELQHLWHEKDRLRGMLIDTIALIDRGEMRPVMYAQVPFSNAGESHRILHDRENIGKVVLVNDVTW